MASTKPDQKGVQRRRDDSLTDGGLPVKLDAARYYRRLRESRFLTTFPQSVGVRLGELALLPERLWHRFRSVRSGSVSAPPAQKAKQSPSSFFIVLEARDKATAGIRGLAGGATRIRGEAVPSIRSYDELTANLRRSYSADSELADGASGFLLRKTGIRGVPMWLVMGLVIALLVAAPLVVLQAALPRFEEFSMLPAQVSGEPSPEDSGGQSANSNDAASAVGETARQGSDFAGAYVIEVRQLSSSRTMLRILVPGGAVGEFRAEVVLEETNDFQCVVLEDRADELLCVGPRLPTGKANILIYHLSDERNSASPVFEVAFFIVGERLGEPGILDPPTSEPAVSPYGTGFTWPDRFNDAEVEREAASNSVLAPASALVTMLVAGAWLLPRQKSDSDRRRTR